MNIQIPNSIKPISNEVAAYIRSHYPNIIAVNDVPIEIQLKWEDRCNHELWYTDCNRFIGDVYTQKTYE